MAGEFIKRDGKIIVNSDIMYAYIPLSLFDDERVSVDIVHSAVASTFGDGFKVMGVFNVRCANGTNAEEKIESAPLKTFIYPMTYMVIKLLFHLSMKNLVLINFSLIYLKMIYILLKNIMNLISF